MIPQTDKNRRDYGALNQNWSNQPTLAGRAILGLLWQFVGVTISRISAESQRTRCYSEHGDTTNTTSEVVLELNVP